MNTASLTSDYQATYSQGEYTGKAEAHAKITATKFIPKDIVIDFGLPVTVHYAPWGTNGVLTGGSALYGTVSVTGDRDKGWNVTYTPNQILQGVDTVTLKADTGASFKFNVYPATTVYYEEGFAVDGFAADGNKGNGTQQTQIVGETDKFNFGYDGIYAGETGMSNGTEAVSKIFGEKTNVDFTGTGFEIYANCTPNTSAAMVRLIDKDTGKLKKMYQVDTAFKAGKTDATNQQTGNAYSLPIVSEQGLAFDNYTVQIGNIKRGATGGDGLHLDGYRIYGTLPLNHAAYPASEKNPGYVELRDMVLTGLNVTEATDPDNVLTQVFENTGSLIGAVVLGKGSQYTQDNMNDLLVNGPKNELYLYQNQAVTFTLKNGVNAQIGLKALNGEVKYTMSGTPKTLTTGTDMFYDITAKNGAVTSTNNSTNILSITLIKYFGAAQTAEVFAELQPEQVQYAMRSLGVLPEPPVVKEDAVLNVQLVDHSGAVVAQTALPQNGPVGEQAAFEADAIRAAVQQILPAGYALVEDYTAGQVLVDFGKQSDVQVQAGKTAVLNLHFVKRTYERSGWLGLKITAVDTEVGTAALTAVQQDASASVKFTANQIREQIPAGYRAKGIVRASSVDFGSSADLTVRVK